MTNSISEITQLWNRILAEIDKNFQEKEIFASFFANTYVYEIRGNTIVVVANTDLACTLMKTRYYSVIQEAVTKITQSNFNVEFLTQDKIKNGSESFVAEQIKKPSYFQHAKLNTNLTFDNFVIGDFNREASQAALLISSNPGKMFNPLFLYSHSGLGKTHLLHAIGNYVIQNGNPNAKILAITANDFVEEYIKYVRGDKESESLKEYVSSFDILLLDDVQLLKDKVKTQEMFFYIYNRMINDGKQVVITSDKQPTELNDLEERMVTRFSQGLVVKIDEPDHTTCVEILKRKITSNGLELDKFEPAVLHFFAEKFSKNVRELEGALNRLIFYCVKLNQSETITMDIAAEAVQSLIGGKALATQLNEQKIINVVADYYNLTPSQLTGKVRTGQIAMARHIAMYLIRYTLDVSLKKIGNTFGGKDHTTVISGVQKVEKELKTNKQLDEAIQELKKRINA